MIEAVPHMQKDLISKSDEEEMQLIIDIITSIRNVRHEMEVSPGKMIEAVIVAKEEKPAKLIKENFSYIRNLARVEKAEIVKKLARPLKQSASAVVGKVTVYIPLAGLIDIEAEKKRLEVKIEALSNDLKIAKSKLSNRNFTSKAPKEVVDKAKARKDSVEEAIFKLKNNIEMLK